MNHLTMNASNLKQIFKDHSEKALLVKLGDNFFPTTLLDTTMVENHGFIEVNLGEADEPCKHMVNTSFSHDLDKGIELAQVAENDTFEENILITCWSLNGERFDLSNQFEIVDDSVVLQEKVHKTTTLDEATAMMGQSLESL